MITPFYLDTSSLNGNFMYIFRIINYDLALSLHHTMFIPAIERLATDEQKSKWLPLALSYQIIGTYAQTELGHGKNVTNIITIMMLVTRPKNHY